MKLAMKERNQWKDEERTARLAALPPALLEVTTNHTERARAFSDV